MSTSIANPFQNIHSTNLMLVVVIMNLKIETHSGFPIKKERDTSTTTIETEYQINLGYREFLDRLIVGGGIIMCDNINGGGGGREIVVLLELN